MTAITLNLLAEEQIEQQQRARDPLKVAIAIGAGMVTLVVAGGVLMSLLASGQRGEMEALQRRLDAARSPELLERETAFAALKKSAEQIVAVNQARHLYAPRLAWLKDLVPENVQLNRLICSMAVQTVQAEAPTESEDVANKRPTRPKVTERLTVRLDGKATSPRPELDVDNFIKTLREHPVFSANLEQIQLRSIARGPVDTGKGGGGLPAAHFVIECSSKERQ